MSLSTMCCLPATFCGRRVRWKSVICSIFCKLEISSRYLERNRSYYFFQREWWRQFRRVVGDRLAPGRLWHNHSKLHLIKTFIIWKLGSRIEFNDTLHGSELVPHLVLGPKNSLEPLILCILKWGVTEFSAYNRKRKYSAVYIGYGDWPPSGGLRSL